MPDPTAVDYNRALDDAARRQIIIQALVKQLVDEVDRPEPDIEEVRGYVFVLAYELDVVLDC